MAHGDAREGNLRGKWRIEWVASTLHTTSEHGVSSITTADAQTSAASSRLNWRPRWFKWTRPFSRKTKSGFCACAITFQMASNTNHIPYWGHPCVTKCVSSDLCLSQIVWKSFTVYWHTAVPQISMNLSSIYVRQKSQQQWVRSQV